MEQWVKSKVPVAKVRELLLQKRKTGVLAEVRKKWRLLPPRQSATNNSTWRARCYLFFGELYLAKFTKYLAKFTKFPGGQARKLGTLDTRGAFTAVEVYGERFEANWNNPAEVAVRAWKDWKNYGEQKRKERKRMRDCGECSASGLLSAVVLTRCWYQRICVFRLPWNLWKGCHIVTEYVFNWEIDYSQPNDRPEKATQTLAGPKNICPLHISNEKNNELFRVYRG